MAAIADPPLDTLVSAPRPEKTYAARRGDLRLVKKPRYPVRGPGGEKVDETQGIIIPFKDGQLRVPLTGTMLTEQGHEVDAAEIIAWLEKHPLNGNHDEGFFSVAQAAPPISEDETEQMNTFALRHDLDSLRAMLEAEQRGWNRPALTRPIEKTIGEIEQLYAEVAAQQEAEAASAKPAAKK